MWIQMDNATLFYLILFCAALQRAALPKVNQWPLEPVGLLRVQQMSDTDWSIVDAHSVTKCLHVKKFLDTMGMGMNFLITRLLFSITRN